MELKNKIVRDLFFSITSEYILNDDKALPLDFLFIDEGEFKKWISSLDQNPDELIDFIEQNHSKRLGRYFENLLHYYFKFHPNIEVLEFGKQIFKGKITIGEMDFILKNKTTSEIIHLETAVKYFAKQKDKSDFRFFICPNGSRNFGDKLDKTFSKQLRITEIEETKAFLNDKKYGDIKSYHFIKGILFYHTDELDGFHHLKLNPKHNKSWWIYQKEVSELSDNSMFKIVPKLNWLSTEVEKDEKELMSKNKLINLLSNHFEIISQGQLIVEFKQNNMAWKEVSRGFVLDNSWPNVDLQISE